MLRYIYACDLPLEPLLQDTMFRDRAYQFKERLGWAVNVDENGWESDEYDALNPLYVIWVNPDGTHGGSMRFLPADGPTMVADHFSGLMKDAPISSPHIWECTRFCVGRNSGPRTAPALMLAGGEVMRAFALTDLLGIFDRRMIRIYKSIGASPYVLGQSGEGRDEIKLGLWRFQAKDRTTVLRRAGLSSDISEHWFLRSFGAPIHSRLAA